MPSNGSSTVAYLRNCYLAMIVFSVVTQVTRIFVYIISFYVPNCFDFNKVDMNLMDAHDWNADETEI
jgi:hypothetical protein